MTEAAAYTPSIFEEDQPATALSNGLFEAVARPYQREAVTAAMEALDRNERALLVQATGTGKTVVFSEIARRFKERGERTLVLAHRIELLEQAFDKLVSFGGFRRYEMGYEVAGQTIGRSKPTVVLASKDSLHAKRLAGYDPGTFGLIIVDEAHRGVAVTYKRVLEYFSSAKLLGVTATPDRLDKKSLGKVFGEITYIYEIRDAIEAGYLVPVRQMFIDVESIDLSKVELNADGDLKDDQVEAILTTEENLHKSVKPTLELAGTRQTLFFCKTIHHAEEIVRVANRYRPDCARSISGENTKEERARTLKDFRAGRFQFLANCAVLTEGVDIPVVACVAMLSPTKSRSKYAQGIGRGTRLLGATMAESISNGKPDVLVLDFVGNSGRHKLVTSLDVLDGNTDDEVRKEAEKLIRSRRAMSEDEQLDVLEALQAAADEIARRNRAKLKANSVSYKAVEVDPFAVIGIHPRAGRFDGAPSSPLQRDALVRMGFSEAEALRIDKGQAMEIISAAHDRRTRGLCTIKQGKRLAQYGFDPDVTFQIAGKMITEIADNGWRVNGENAARLRVLEAEGIAWKQLGKPAAPEHSPNSAAGVAEYAFGSIDDPLPF